MARQSKKVLLDASVLFAFIDRAHPKHEEAAAYFRYFAESEYQLFLPIGNLTQAYMQIYQDISPSLGKDFIRTILLSNINLVYPEETDIKAAVKALITYRSTDLTLQSAISAVLANKRGIQQVCTFEYLPSLFGLTVFYLPI